MYYTLKFNILKFYIFLYFWWFWASMFLENCSYKKECIRKNLYEIFRSCIDFLSIFQFCIDFFPILLSILLRFFTEFFDFFFFNFSSTPVGNFFGWFTLRFLQLASYINDNDHCPRARVEKPCCVPDVLSQ